MIQKKSFFFRLLQNQNQKFKKFTIKEWQILQNSFNVEESPQFLHIVSQLKYGENETTLELFFDNIFRQISKIAESQTQCFLKKSQVQHQQKDKICYSICPFERSQDSLTVAILILLSSQYTTVDMDLLMSAKEFINYKAPRFSSVKVKSQVIKTLSQMIPSFYCKTPLFQVRWICLCDDNQKTRCRKCGNFDDIKFMGLFSGKRLVCRYCSLDKMITHYNLHCCHKCWCYYPHGIKHRCVDERVWQCVDCKNIFHCTPLENLLCDWCFLKRPVIETSKESLNPECEWVVAPKSYNDIIDSCSICSASKEKLTLLCSNIKCLAVGCQKCFNKWFTQNNQPGGEFVVSKTRCPFCRNSPRFHESLPFQIRRNVEIGSTLDLSKSYAICSQCPDVFPVPKSCNTGQISNFVCQTCEKWKMTTNAKLCPNCGVCIEKVGGCDHITCDVCNHEWCYRCRASLPSGLGLFGHQCEATENVVEPIRMQPISFFRFVLDITQILLIVFLLLIGIFLISWSSLNYKLIKFPKLSFGFS